MYTQAPRPAAQGSDANLLSTVMTLSGAPFSSGSAVNVEGAWRVASGPFTASWRGADQSVIQGAFPVFLITAFLLVHRWDNHENIRSFVGWVPKTALWPILALVWMLALTVSQGSSAKFIYFDF